MFPRGWEELTILSAGLHFILSCKSWKVTGWQWYWKRTPMWSKGYFYLSVTAGFKKSPSKKGKLKLPLLFSGEHRPVNLYMTGPNIRLFPRLFVYIASFWLGKAAPSLASCIPSEMPALPCLLWGARRSGVGSGPCGEEGTWRTLWWWRAHILLRLLTYFLHYLFLTWLPQAH